MEPRLVHPSDPERTKHFSLSDAFDVFDTQMISWIYEDILFWISYDSYEIQKGIP